MADVASVLILTVAFLASVTVTSLAGELGGFNAGARTGLGLVELAQNYTPSAPIEVAPAPSIGPFLGPSFPCPEPHDPLAQLICSTSDLSLLDLQFVETYQALRQQVGATGQTALRQESIDFGLAVRSACGIALAITPTSSAPAPPDAPPGAGPCVLRAYLSQKAQWDSRLQGPAAEESSRPLTQQALIQRQLQVLGYLPASASIDAVFGSGTRVAILAWQLGKGRPATGLLGNADAAALMQDTATSSITPTAGPQASIPVPASPSPATFVPGISAVQVGEGDADWQALSDQASAQGLTVSYSQGSSGCTISATMDDATVGKLTDAFIASSAADAGQQASWRSHKFTVGMLLLKAAFSAPMVKRFYADHSGADVCQFSMETNGFDDFGQPAPKPIYTFALSRSIYARINWAHFIPTNLDKVASAFMFSPDAAAQLKKESGG